jgi:hypothetical protein
MCDYSLRHVASTPAKVGDVLVTTEFETSITRGFCAVGSPGVAVCVPPGAEIAFERDVERARWLPFLRGRRMGALQARFRQVDIEKPDSHHDALEFPDGRIVLLTDLAPGQRATVLQLPRVNTAKAPVAETGAAPVARPVDSNS